MAEEKVWHIQAHFGIHIQHVDPREHPRFIGNANEDGSITPHCVEHHNVVASGHDENGEWWCNQHGKTLTVPEGYE